SNCGPLWVPCTSSAARAAILTPRGAGLPGYAHRERPLSTRFSDRCDGTNELSLVALAARCLSGTLARAGPGSNRVLFGREAKLGDRSLVRGLPGDVVDLRGSVPLDRVALHAVKLAGAGDSPRRHRDPGLLGLGSRSGFS